jgi:hypothetical protein
MDEDVRPFDMGAAPNPRSDKGANRVGNSPTLTIRNLVSRSYSPQISETGPSMVLSSPSGMRRPLIPLISCPLAALTFLSRAWSRSYASRSAQRSPHIAPARSGSTSTWRKNPAAGGARPGAEPNQSEDDAAAGGTTPAKSHGKNDTADPNRSISSVAARTHPCSVPGGLDYLQGLGRRPRPARLRAFANT